MPKPAPKAPSPGNLLAAGLAFIGSGSVLAAVGQTMLHKPPMAYAGLVILAIGTVFLVISQKGK